MEETLISFETAKLAKDKGFDALCLNSFDSDGRIQVNDPLNKTNKCFLNKCDVCYSAPTQSLLTKWLREKHGIYVEVKIDIVSEPYKFSHRIVTFPKKPQDQPLYNYLYNTYEEALEIGLKIALELI